MRTGSFLMPCKVALRSLLCPRVLLGFALLHLLALLFVLPSGPLTDAREYTAKVQVLGLLFWLPGLFVAARLRTAWEALGPGDPGLLWIRLMALPQALPRGACLLAAVIALVVLQAGSGLLVASALYALDGRPEFHRSQELLVKGESQILSKWDDSEDFVLPSYRGEASLSLHPLWLLGKRASVELVVGFAGPLQPEGQTLGRVRIADIGSKERFLLPAKCRTGGILRFIRVTKQELASPISLARGSLMLLGQQAMSPLLAVPLLSLRLLPWGLLLLALSLALSTITAPDIHFVALLGLTPVSTALPIFATLENGSKLASGMATQPSLPQLSLILTIVVLLTFGVFWPRRFRAHTEDACAY